MSKRVLGASGLLVVAAWKTATERNVASEVPAQGFVGTHALALRLPKRPKWGPQHATGEAPCPQKPFPCAARPSSACRARDGRCWLIALFGAKAKPILSSSTISRSPAPAAAGIERSSATRRLPTSRSRWQPARRDRKTFGVTNIIALDAERNITQDQRVILTRDDARTVNLSKGSERESYSCTPSCSPTLTIGDDKDYFSRISQHATAKTRFSSGAGGGNNNND